MSAPARRGQPHQPAIGDPAVPLRPVVGWVLYDLANTIFSLVVVSRYFSVWIVDDLGGRDAHFGVANGLSMAVMLVLAPFLGALSDQTPRRMPLLVGSTLLCCVFTAVLGSGGIWTALVLFGLANLFFQAGLIFYDALLPVVSTPGTRGRVGGLGVGVGYVGSFVGLAAGLLILGADETAEPRLFAVTAALFLMFAIPCFLWVREPPRPNAVPFGRESIARAARELRGTVALVRGYPTLRRFLIGRVFYADAANTLIAFLGIYLTEELDFGGARVDAILALSILFAIAGGILWGRVADRIGPKRTLDRVLAVWAIVLGLTASVAFFDLPTGLIWAVGPLAGIALGGTWAADRPLMLRLSPPALLGQFYGLYAMVGRFAAVLGPLAWALIVDGLGWGRPAAVTSLLVLVGVAWVILRGVDDGGTEPATGAT